MSKSKDISQKINKAGNLLADTVADSLSEARTNHDNALYDEGFSDGITYQKSRDIKSVVQAFLDLNVDTDKIYRLLNEYLGVDSISDVSELILNARVSKSIEALKEYCIKNGMTALQFKEYRKEKQIDDRLISDEKLLSLQPEKLKAILNKN